MSGEVRVLLHHVADDVDEIEAAYRRVSRRLEGVPGLLSNELLRSMDEPKRYVVASTWSDPSAFRQWEQGREHLGQTEPLRPFRSAASARPFGLYRVIAAF